MEKKNVAFELRPWSIEDLPALVKHANNPQVARFMSDVFPNPYTEEAGRRFIEFATAHDPIHIFAISVNGEAIGGIGVHPQSDIQQKNAEIGYWLGESYWGKGIITEAIKRILPIAFDLYDIERLFGRTFSRNIASGRALERAGFIKEYSLVGSLYKNGQLEDETMYGFRRHQLK